MTKISFCGISGSGMSALAQIRLHQGYEVRGSDRSFDQGKDQSNKQALEKLGIKIYPQDGSAITDDLDVLYVSTYGVSLHPWQTVHQACAIHHAPLFPHQVFGH